MENILFLATINDDEIIGYQKNLLVKDDRYLTYFRPSYNFSKLIKVIKTSFEEIEKLNDNPDQEIDIKVKEENIENALKGLEYLSKNKYYSKNERDLFLEIIKQFDEVEDKKEFENNDTNTNYFYYYLDEIKTMFLSTYFNVKFYIEGLFN